MAFSVQVRARYVWLALRTPDISEYSHLHESAVFAYYKREYAAGVCLLLVALEGVLLSINAWRVSQPNKPSFTQLKATVAEFDVLLSINPEMNAIQAAFRDALSAFIDRWIYAHTSNADFTLSVLIVTTLCTAWTRVTFTARTTFTASCLGLTSSSTSSP